MKKIFKYQLKLQGEEQIVKLPKGSKIVHFYSQNNILYFWAEITSKAKEDRYFVVIGTGQDIPDGYGHIATVLVESFVWHLYERKHE